jgi:high-affinity Fe2+/Pb2+ permease
MENKDLEERKKKLESLILYDFLLIAAFLGALLLQMVFYVARGAYVFATILLLFLALMLLAIRLMSYHKVLNSIPAERNKSIWLPLKKSLWGKTR